MFRNTLAFAVGIVLSLCVIGCTNVEPTHYVSTGESVKKVKVGKTKPAGSAFQQK